MIVGTYRERRHRVNGQEIVEKNTLKRHLERRNEVVVRVQVCDDLEATRERDDLALEVFLQDAGTEGG